MGERLRFYCSCGGSASASSTPPEMATQVIDAFRRMHDRDGCREVDRAEWNRVRRQQRRDEWKVLDGG